MALWLVVVIVFPSYLCYFLSSDTVAKYTFFIPDPRNRKLSILTDSFKTYLYQSGWIGSTLWVGLFQEALYKFSKWMTLKLQFYVPEIIEFTVLILSQLRSTWWVSLIYILSILCTGTKRCKALWCVDMGISEFQAICHRVWTLGVWIILDETLIGKRTSDSFWPC